MGLGHNRTGRLWYWDSVGLRDNVTGTGLRDYVTGTQWDWKTMGLGDYGTGAQLDEPICMH